MKIKLVYINPGGNKTALILTDVKRLNQHKIAKSVMKKISDCEQVGFIEKSKLKKTVCRLQMMGGEFCGNALRSLGAFLFLEKRSNKQSEKFLVESSGLNKPIEIVIEFRKKLSSGTTIPMPKLPEVLELSLNFLNKKVPATLVKMEGISHFIISDKFFNKKIDFSKIFFQIYKQGLTDADACGLIFYKQISSSNYSIKPIVFVKETNTIVYETSCASGSVAMAIAKQAKTISLKQPSGYFLAVNLRPGGSFVSGEVLGIEMMELEV